MSLANSLEVGGKAAGGAMLALIVVRFIQWSAQFLAGRYDARLAALDKREAWVDGKVIARLRKLEERVTRLDRATTILIAKVRREHPESPELAMVHRILDDSIPLDLNTPDDMNTTLEQLK